MATASVTNTFAAATTIESSKANQNFSDLLTFLNTTGVNVYQANSVDKNAISSALSAQLGVNDGSNVRRGYVSNSAESTAVTSTSYGSLNTADKVSSVVVPAGGVVRVHYSALWRATGASVSTHGYFALFIGGTQAKYVEVGTVPSVYETPLTSQASTTSTGDGPILGLSAASPGTSANDSSFVTTGLIGDTRDTLFSGAEGTDGNFTFYVHRLAAGTYDFEFKYKAVSGQSVYVKERILQVEVASF